MPVRLGPGLCVMQLTDESLLVAIPAQQQPEDGFDNQENCAAAANASLTAAPRCTVGGAGCAAPAGRLLVGRVLTMQASDLRGGGCSLLLSLQVSCTVRVQLVHCLLSGHRHCRDVVCIAAAVMNPTVEAEFQRLTLTLA